MTHTQHVSTTKTLVVAALCLLHGAAAAGSEQSKRLSARGVVDLHAGRYEQALQLFEQAVQADPGDPYALYYRGIARGRLGYLPGAVADLRTVVSRQEPGLQPAILDLGVALVQMGAYREAVLWLAQAQAIPNLEAQASLFLGIAQLRLDEIAGARRNLARAARLDPQLRPAARYYAGVADYRAGAWSAAERRFADVARSSPQTEMGRQARAFLARIHQGEQLPFQAYGSVGFQYDSNVVLAPASGAIANELKISRQADGRATLEAGALYVPWHEAWGQLSLGYDFYQSLHFQLTDFNLQDHRPSAQFTVNAGPVQLGLLGSYDYYFLSTDSFLQDGEGLPWISVPEDAFGRTEAFYRFRRRDFFQRAYRIRDALNHAAGARQFFYLGAPERYLFVGYRFDHEIPVHQDADSQMFGYEGHQAEGGIGWAFPAALSAELSYAYRHERYAAESNGRADDDHEVIALLRKELSDHLAVTAAYFGTIDNSTAALFDYQRHIGSLALEVRY